MNGNQKAAYRRLAEDGSALIGGHLIQPSNDLALRTYQRIAADGLQHWGVNSSGKADVIVQMIQDSEGTPTLVFTSWKALAHNIHARLEDAGVRSGVVTGDEGDAGRDLTCSMFQDGKLDVVVAVYDVMQFGLNLQRATHAILAGLQYNPKKMEQSIARGSRIGGGSLLVTLLISEDSVEEEVHENVVRPKLKLTETLRVAGDIERIMAADTTEYEWVR
jgi:superfamily II DNA/RNA helicase